MNSLTRYLLVLSGACACFLTGCVSTVPPVTAQMAATAGKPVALLEHGRQLYGGACASCHAPEATTKYSATEWPGIVADMGKRAKLSAADQETVLAYALASRAATVAQR